MIDHFTGRLTRYLSNWPGWATKRKIIVFESDDWGSVRMPSIEAFCNLKDAGIQIEKSRYNRLDSLETNHELESFFEILSSFKDQNGNHPVITGLCVVANPDFEKIRGSGFCTYYYESVAETTMRSPKMNRVTELWKEGAERRIFVPQFHGREHLNVRQWLNDLKSNDRHAQIAFKNGLWGIGTESSPQGYQAAFDVISPLDIQYHRTVLDEGLNLFKEIMGYNARHFVPPNGPFNVSLEEILSKKGIEYITLDKIQKEPLGNGKYKTHFNFLGKSSKIGMMYLSRNADFEPSRDGTSSIGKCMQSIQDAFRMRKPATISTHRLNYIATLDPHNRDIGLFGLSALIKEILKKFPDVEFLTSVELGQLIALNKNN
jgi:hypothetical protein